MSSALAAVRFPDGRVRWTIYHGTSDVLSNALYDSPAGAWLGPRWFGNGPHGAWEAVDIYSDYGGGFWWRGVASKVKIRSEFCQPHGAEDQAGNVLISAVDIQAGMPDWATRHFKKPAKEI